MREDMFKVIVERPRHGRFMKSEYPCPHDLEKSPSHEGLKRRHRYRKSLNENLNPLARFLAKQVNRPWDKVFSELCENIDRRSTVQQHIHQHIDDYVARTVFIINGELHSVRHWGEPVPLAELWRVKLYVDPETGILRNNVFREQRVARNKQKRMLADAEIGQHRRVLDGGHQLHCLHGLWFFVTLDRVPKKPEGTVRAKTKQRAAIPMDVIRKMAAWDCPSRKDEKNMVSNQTLFGDWQLYAVSKRQLNSCELRRFGLHNN